MTSTEHISHSSITDIYIIANNQCLNTYRALLEDGPMTPIYFFIIYFSIYTFLGFTSSFISEYIYRKENRSLSSFCSTWNENMGHWREYYHSFALHVIHEGFIIASLISYYIICEDIHDSSDINEWKLLTRVPKPGMILLLSFIVWTLYKVASIIYLVANDVFSWTQVALHIIDCNYLFEMFIAHSNQNLVEY